MSIGNIGSIGSASQEQLDHFTSKFGPHPKSLKDQYIEDCEVLAELQITSQQIADRCEVIFLKAMNLFENHSSKNPREICNSAIIEGKFEITGFAIRAMCKPSPCPFTVDHPCGYGLGTFNIKNINTGEVIKIYDLQLHIIRDHKFFARTGTSSRIDPGLACRILELSPGVDYSKELQVRDIWESIHAKKACPKKHKKELETTAVQSQAIDSYTTAFLMETGSVESDLESKSSGSDFEWEEFLEKNESTPPEDREEVEGEPYLHVIFGKNGFIKNEEVCGRRIEYLSGEQGGLSVLKASTKKYATAGDGDCLIPTSI